MSRLVVRLCVRVSQQATARSAVSPRRIPAFIRPVSTSAGSFDFFYCGVGLLCVCSLQETTRHMQTQAGAPCSTFPVSFRSRALKESKKRWWRVTKYIYFLFCSVLLYLIISTFYIYEVGLNSVLFE